MGYMVPEVFQSRWLAVDTSHGVQIIPEKVATLTQERYDQVQDLLDTRQTPLLVIELLPELADYCDSRTAEVYDVDQCFGWLARLTAPGYMDSTDWCFGATEQDALESLCDMHGACGSDDDECFCGRCERWTVVVGNVGTVYNGLDEEEARKEYKQAVASAALPGGRDSGETVTLCRDEEIVEDSNPAE